VATTEHAVRRAMFSELTPTLLHAILKLRSDVFVVEQECAYSDIDGRDSEPQTLHLWIEDDAGAVVATARILRGDGVPLIGRIVTRADVRGRGLGALLMHTALHLAGRPVEIKAQARLASWYERFGFVRCSGEWVEDGIAHIQMRCG
jgi:ElaA protein